jgi:uncharacterized damage-inducible protein DinB
MDISDLVRYNDRVRGLCCKALAELPWQEVVKPIGLSFDSMRDVFLHLTLVEDRWINYTLVEHFNDWKDLVFEDFADMNKLGTYMIRVHEKTENFLRTLKPEDYKRTVANPWVEDTSISIETGLTHLVLECMVHFGELSAAFWQKGEEAPYLAFLRYELSKTKKGLHQA